MDFVVDGLSRGRLFRGLTVIDTHSRECLTIEADRSLSRVTRVPAWVIAQRVSRTRYDATTGRSSRAATCCGSAEQKTKLMHIHPGWPVQNGRVESFHGRFRDEGLNTHRFATLAEARKGIEEWRNHTTNSDRSQQLGLSDTGGVCLIPHLAARRSRWQGERYWPSRVRCRRTLPGARLTASAVPPGRQSRRWLRRERAAKVFKQSMFSITTGRKDGGRSR